MTERVANVDKIADAIENTKQNFNFTMAFYNNSFYSDEVGEAISKLEQAQKRQLESTINEAIDQMLSFLSAEIRTMGACEQTPCALCRERQSHEPDYSGQT